MDGGKNLWNFAVTNAWRSPDKNEDSSWAQQEKEEQYPQRAGNYVKSWFSSEEWSKSVDSMEKAVFNYSIGLIEATPSYNTVPGQPVYTSNVPLVGLEISYDYSTCYSIGYYLPSTVIAGAIGQ